jgi:DNA-binding response OmpR family regulator
MPDILILDDDEELFSLLDEYLKDEGFSCVHAPDAAAGLERIGKRSFDAAVLDVMLPGMNGFEVLRRLRANERSSVLPVLMLTARGEEIDRIVGLEMGADDYLGKPFNPRELVARLRAILRRSASGGTEQARAVQRIDDLNISWTSHCVDVEGIAVKMIQAGNNPALLKTAGAANQERGGLFSTSRRLEAVLKVYRSILREDGLYAE